MMAMRNRGAYNPKTGYCVGDVVTFEGGAYRCVRPANGVSPNTNVRFEVWKRLNQDTEQAVLLIGDCSVDKLDVPKYGLPVLHLKGGASAMSKDNAVDLAYGYGERSGTASVKWQGSSSLYFPKKNYTIEFDQAFEAKAGWGEHAKYCLKANWVDASNIRNILGAILWGKMVKLRTDITDPRKSMPNGGAIDGFPIWVTINGESMGLYTMNIPKEPWLFGMTDAYPAAGFICGEDYLCDKPAVGDGTDIKMEYAAGDKTVLLASFNNMISALNSVQSAADLPALEAVLDVKSVIDYYAHCAFICNHDGIWKNYIMGTYDGVKWFISAYDMDATFGTSADGTSYLWPNAYPTFDLGDSLNKLFIVAKTYYKEQIKETYQARRGWEFGEFDLYQAAYTLANQFPKALVMEDFRLWPERPSTNVNDVQAILDYARIRGGSLDWTVQNM